MERIQNILRHPEFLTALSAIEQLEEQREYCKHNIDHFLHVARIGYLLNLERNLGIKKEWIYAAALLHDTGKYEQYLSGVPHEVVSVGIASVVLTDCGFQAAEIRPILSAIKTHRSQEKAQLGKFNQLLYEADKRSRACALCKVKDTCNWEADEKGTQLYI